MSSNALTPERRAELRRLCAAATALPWHWGTGRSEVLCEDGILDRDGNAVWVSCGRAGGDPTDEDAAYVVAACNAALALLDALDAAEKERDKERGRAEWVDGLLQRAERGIVAGLTRRVAAQSEALSRCAEKGGGADRAVLKLVADLLAAPEIDSGAVRQVLAGYLGENPA